MAATDPADEIAELSSKLDTIEAVVDPEAMRTEARDLREQANDPGLWEDQARAQRVTRRLSYLEGELARMENLRLTATSTPPPIKTASAFAELERDPELFVNSTSEPWTSPTSPCAKGVIRVR